MNDEQSQSSIITSLNFERSSNDCITVTTCCVSENQQPFHTIDNISENNVPPADISYLPSDSNQNTRSLHLNSKRINIGHLKVQGICGDKMSKFSEISAIPTDPENNKLHIFGMGETKLKKT